MSSPAIQRRTFLQAVPVAAATATLVPATFGSRQRDADPPVDLERYRPAAIERWATTIAELEARDRSETHPDDSILLIGSSSIRLWDNISADLAPYHPIQRGYGGAKWSDVAVFADRLLRPHTFRAAVLFVGNDIAGKDDDKTPLEVAGLFSFVLGRARAHQPSAHVFFVAVTPTAARFAAWPQIKAANSAARDVCLEHERAHFIGTESIFLGADGHPRGELFRDDRLHLNRQGYIRWAAAIQSHLDTVFNGAG